VVTARHVAEACPRCEVARDAEPALVPEAADEGRRANVVFVEGLVRDGDRWLFYDGGADKHIGVAAAPSAQSTTPVSGSGPGSGSTRRSFSAPRGSESVWDR
jgi:predicted GH43/DUF377 family glycosyl hydrolase